MYKKETSHTRVILDYLRCRRGSFSFELIDMYNVIVLDALIITFGSRLMFNKENLSLIMNGDRVMLSVITPVVDTYSKKWYNATFGKEPPSDEGVLVTEYYSSIYEYVLKTIDDTLVRFLERLKWNALYYSNFDIIIETTQTDFNILDLEITLEYDKEQYNKLRGIEYS